MIILIMEDDIAYNNLNPSPGLVTVSPGGKNLHDNIRIDYKMSDLYPEDICNIIAGKPTSRITCNGRHGHRHKPPYILERSRVSRSIKLGCV